VGDAWEREVDAGRGAELYQDDGSHPSARGDRLAARVFYETLFPKPF
jgi:lysophospholipase L1-like esterase